MSKLTQIEDRLGVLEFKTSNIEPAFNPQKHDSETRSQIAYKFVNWYFWLISGVLFVGLVNNWLAASFHVDTQVFNVMHLHPESEAEIDQRLCN